MAVVGLVCSIFSYFLVKNWIDRGARLDFRQAAENRVLAIQRELDADVASLRAVAALYDAVGDVSRRTFRRFTRLAAEDPSVESLEWIPVVPEDDVSRFVESVRAEGFDYFRLRTAAGEPAPPAPEHYPIAYATAFREEVLGIDLAAEETSRAAVIKARDTGETVATPRVPLKESPQSHYGFIVYIPVYDPAAEVDTEAQRQASFRGVLRATFDIAALVEESLRYLDQEKIRVTLYDGLADPGDRLLYSTSPEEQPAVPVADWARITDTLDIAGRKWVVLCEPADVRLRASWQPWTVLGVGLLFTGLLTAYLRSLTGQARAVQSLVDERTAELAQKVTERQEALRQLRRSEELFRDLFETSQALIFTHDLEGTILTINPAAAASLGYSTEEMIGRNLRDFVIPTERHRFGNYLETVKGELRLYTKNGATRFWLYHNTRLEEEGAPPVVRAHALDVTEGKQTERELSRLSHQNQLILNAAGEGIYGINLAGECTFVNPAAAILTGYETEDLLGTELPVHDILQGKRENGEAYPFEDSPAYATLHDGQVRRVTDEVMFRKGGSSFPIDYVCTPIVEDDRIVGAVVTFQDVTDRKAVERMKNEFISIVSHELRTPLTSIRGSLGLLASGVLKKAPERAESMLKIAVQNTDRLVRLINDILDIERLESGKVTIQPRDCRLDQLMAQAAEVMEAMASANSVKLEVLPLDRVVQADPDRILQVLTNLLSNAIKFSSPGSKVELFARGDDGEVVVGVRDYGRGIPGDKLETIFERFGQVDASDSREKGGTGLGLPICRTIVEQHGAKLLVESQPGEGSLFWFTLPTNGKAA